MRIVLYKFPFISLIHKKKLKTKKTKNNNNNKKEEREGKWVNSHQTPLPPPIFFLIRRKQHSHPKWWVWKEIIRNPPKYSSLLSLNKHP